MATATKTIKVVAGGIELSAVTPVVYPGLIVQDLNDNDKIAAAKVGSITTRTDNTSGTLTMNGGHGITTGDKVDIYWNVGGVAGRRYDVTVGTVSVNSVPFSGGSGDSLPAQASAITAMVQIVIDTDFLGDLVKLIAARCEARGHVSFFNGNSNVLAVDLVAGGVWEWDENAGGANPLATLTVTQVKVTHDDSNAAKAFGLIGLYDSV